ncbi:hypothetical protein GCM10007160_08550 [Litchfieldella qijiaojingensis]|uniref:AAA family ATPase n=1 Tax=Litchfieldella qijiaojingensis TaxID=980347 RepID=A0ABQ2YHV6_9GAMM|nr:AAA family ATPase [Halomonas qijiaojingensis]GGX83606.1 hypothetical protein GCM10007160_08550 [Halomonas qijiaojingensis]
MNESIGHHPLLGNLPRRGELSLASIDELVERLENCHERAAQVAADSELGSPEATERLLAREFAWLEKRLRDESDLQRLQALSIRAEEAHRRLHETFVSRRRDGCVREIGGGEWRGCDVACDLAYLLVALEVCGGITFSRHALNHYLELSGDYELVRLLDHYKLYHAVAWAKAAWQSDADDRLDVFRHYLTLAERYAEFRFPYLVIGVGVSGSGKSRFTGEMVRRLGSIRLRSDVERKRLHSLFPQADSHRQAVDIYTPEATRQTYRQLAKLTGILLESGLPTCIDATCLKQEQRELLREQAEARGLPVLMVSFEADVANLRRRIEKRARRAGESPVAGLAVLEQQLAERDPFADDERHQLVHLDTTAPNASENLVELIHQHMRLP